MAEVEEDLRRWSMRRSRAQGLGQPQRQEENFVDARARGVSDLSRHSTLRSRASTTWSSSTAAESDADSLVSKGSLKKKKNMQDGPKGE
jgi:hypothetical protein